MNLCILCVDINCLQEVCVPLACENHATLIDKMDTDRVYLRRIKKVVRFLLVNRILVMFEFADGQRDGE